MTMGRRPNWTPEEIDFLRERWGTYKSGIPALAKHLGRSAGAVKQKAQELKLGPYLHNGDYVAINTIYFVIYHRNISDYAWYTWRRAGIPSVNVRVNNSIVKTITLNRFWSWAKKNQSLLDFSQFAKGALGLEPAWVDKKRQVDIENRLATTHKHRWSTYELNLLTKELERGATYAELSETLHRSHSAIRRKIYDLNLPPPQRDTQRQWSDAELKRLEKMAKQGYNVDACAAALGRSPSAVRSKMELLKYTGKLGG